MTTNLDGRDGVDVDPVDPDYPVTPVPLSARKSFLSLAVVLLGFTIFTPTMLAGAQLGPAFGFGELLLVILAGSAILGTYVALMGYVGARTGLTTVVMALPAVMDPMYWLGQDGLFGSITFVPEPSSIVMGRTVVPIGCLNQARSCFTSPRRRGSSFLTIPRSAFR